MAITEIGAVDGHPGEVSLGVWVAFWKWSRQS